MASEEDQSRAHNCFLQWMNLQEQDLTELLRALTSPTNPENTILTDLLQKNITHFQEYTYKRTQLAKNDVSTFFAPAWNSSLENSLLWIAGCRPTMFIRLLYALCGSEAESHMEMYFQGERKGSLGELTGRQMNMVNELHIKTLKEEERLTSKLASLQEEIGDEPISVVCKGQMGVGEVDERVDRALEGCEKGMVSVMEEADNLRLSTVKELVGILAPVQAVDYIAAGKKLHLCVHEWGKIRDRVHGRGN